MLTIFNNQLHLIFFIIQHVHFLVKCSKTIFFEFFRKLKAGSHIRTHLWARSNIAARTAASRPSSDVRTIVAGALRCLCSGNNVFIAAFIWWWLLRSKFLSFSSNTSNGLLYLSGSKKRLLPKPLMILYDFLCSRPRATLRAGIPALPPQHSKSPMAFVAPSGFSMLLLYIRRRAEARRQRIKKPNRQNYPLKGNFFCQARFRSCEIQLLYQQQD